MEWNGWDLILSGAGEKCDNHPWRNILKNLQVANLERKHPQETKALATTYRLRSTSKNSSEGFK